MIHQVDHLPWVRDVIMLAMCFAVPMSWPTIPEADQVEARPHCAPVLVPGERSRDTILDYSECDE